MPQGSKAKYTTKQKRKARHIEEGYEKRGVRAKEAGRRAWATVNKESGGGKKSGSGRGKLENGSASRKGGRTGGRATASRSTAARRTSAGKAAARTAGSTPRSPSRKTTATRRPTTARKTTTTRKSPSRKRRASR